MTPVRTGYLFGTAAYLCWGVFPLYWRLLRPSSAAEILAHRIIWSLLLIALIVTVARSWGRIAVLVRHPRQLALLGLASVLIAINWGTYIYGVNAERVVETSLGYFINPLVTMLLGVIMLREWLSPTQWVAMSIGTVAVGVLTYDYGHVPYLALTLAVSFGLYGLIKKRLGVPATDGLLVESAVLTIPALAFLAILGGRGQSTFGNVSIPHTALMIVGGVITALPLLLFAGAANRIPLSAIGLLQYLAPILQLAIGVLGFGEPMPPLRAVGFALVWLALGVFTWDGIRRARSHSPSTMSSGASAPLGAR